MGDHHLPVMPEPPVLTDGSLYVRLPRLLHLMMNLALGRPTLAVVAGALASLIILMRMTLMTNSTRRHFSTLSRPPVSLFFNRWARSLRPKKGQYLLCTAEDFREKLVDARGHR